MEERGLPRPSQPGGSRLLFPLIFSLKALNWALPHLPYPTDFAGNGVPVLPHFTQYFGRFIICIFPIWACERMEAGAGAGKSGGRERETDFLSPVPLVHQP